MIMIKSKEELKKIIINLEKTLYNSIKRNLPNNLSTELIKPEGLFRNLQLNIYPYDVLKSYLIDLEETMGLGYNLMLDRFLKMEDLITLKNGNRLIGKIMEIESKWYDNIFTKSKNIFESVSYEIKKTLYKNLTYEKYKRSELDGLSNMTLDYYYKYVFKCMKNDENPLFKVFDTFFSYKASHL